MESQWTLQKTSWNSSTVVYFGQRTIKTCILFPGLLSYDPKNLDNVSCCKTEVKNISSDNEIPDALEGRTVAPTLGLTHVSNESLWKPKGTVRGPSGRGNHCPQGKEIIVESCLKFCFGYSMKIMATKVDMGFFIIFPNSRSLEKLLTYTEFFIIIITIIKESGCWRLTLSTFECKWFWTGFVCVCFVFTGDFLNFWLPKEYMFIVSIMKMQNTLRTVKWPINLICRDNRKKTRTGRRVDFPWINSWKWSTLFLRLS